MTPLPSMSSTRTMRWLPESAMLIRPLLVDEQPPVVVRGRAGEHRVVERRDAAPVVRGSPGPAGPEQLPVECPGTSLVRRVPRRAKVLVEPCVLRRPGGELAVEHPGTAREVGLDRRVPPREGQRRHHEAVVSLVQLVHGDEPSGPGTAATDRRRARSSRRVPRALRGTDRPDLRRSPAANRRTRARLSGRSPAGTFRGAARPLRRAPCGRRRSVRHGTASGSADVDLDTRRDGDRTVCRSATRRPSSRRLELVQCRAEIPERVRLVVVRPEQGDEGFGLCGCPSPRGTRAGPLTSCAPAPQARPDQQLGRAEHLNSNIPPLRVKQRPGHFVATRPRRQVRWTRHRGRLSCTHSRRGNTERE